MIVYFSATGNSRYTAKMLADILGDETVCANDYIKESKGAQLESEKPWVFICPVYLSAIPRVFEDFIRKSSFGGTKSAYFIVTSAGTSPCACPAFAEKLSEEKGFECRGTANVSMPQNYLVFFKTAEKAECEKKIADAAPRIRELGGYISEGLPFPDSGMKKWELITTYMILEPYYRWFMKADKFTAGDKCIGCGKCVRSCPLGNISLVDKKPVWGDRCTHCVACINLCPTAAIEYGKSTVGKPRYSCPEYNSK